MYSNNHVSNIKLDSKVQHIDLAKFGVRDSLLKGIWSGNVRLIIPKLTEKNLSVDLRADSIIANRSSKPFKVQNLAAQLDYKKNAPSKFNLYSDPISINAEGVLDHTTIFETIKSTLTQHISTFHAGHDLQQGRLARAVEAEHADLRTVEVAERDILEHFALAVTLGHAVHRIDDFIGLIIVCHRCSMNVFRLPGGARMTDNQRPVLQMPRNLSRANCPRGKGRARHAACGSRWLSAASPSPPETPAMPAKARRSPHRRLSRG